MSKPRLPLPGSFATSALENRWFTVASNHRCFRCSSDLGKLRDKAERSGPRLSVNGNGPAFISMQGGRYLSAVHAREESGVFDFNTGVNEGSRRVFGEVFKVA